MASTIEEVARDLAEMGNDVIGVLVRGTNRSLDAIGVQSQKVYLQGGSGKLNMRSGRLIRSIVGALTFAQEGDSGQREGIRKVRVSGDRVTGEIGSEVPYAAAHEFGTAPYEILPIKAKALRFVLGGQVIFAQSVQHPGQKKRPFLEPALEDVRDKFPSLFELELQSLINKFEKN